MGKDFSLSTLAGNLISLRQKTGKTQKDIAGELGITASTLSAYEKGTREPSLGAVVKLAQYYNVSVDFLLGIDNADDINKQIIETQADYLRHIIALTEALVPCDIKIVEARFNAGNEVSLLIYPEWAVQFVDGYIRIKSLKDGNYVDAEQYSILIENLLKRFNDPVLQRVDDDELPF